MAEANILAYAKRRARALGFRPLRMTLRQGVEVGWPDLMILGPRRWVLFMETKAPGKPAAPIQLHRRDEIEALGHLWCKPDTRAAVDAALAHFARLIEGTTDA